MEYYKKINIFTSIELSSVRILLLSAQIQCSLSGHEMPCRVDVLKSYVSGKKFTRLKAHHDFDFTRLEPFLIPSKKRKYDDQWHTKLDYN